VDKTGETYDSKKTWWRRLQLQSITQPSRGGARTSGWWCYHCFRWVVSVTKLRLLVSSMVKRQGAEGAKKKKNHWCPMTPCHEGGSTLAAKWSPYTVGGDRGTIHHCTLQYKVLCVTSSTKTLSSTSVTVGTRSSTLFCIIRKKTLFCITQPCYISVYRNFRLHVVSLLCLYVNAKPYREKSKSEKPPHEGFILMCW
jgi:hypothetical protein